MVDPDILAQVQKGTAAKLKELEAETGMAESEKARIMEELKATDTKAEAMRRAKGNHKDRFRASFSFSIPFYFYFLLFIFWILTFRNRGDDTKIDDDATAATCWRSKHLGRACKTRRTTSRWV